MSHVNESASDITCSAGLLVFLESFVALTANVNTLLRLSLIVLLTLVARKLPEHLLEVFALSALVLCYV